jgi:hypothetical protein
MTSIVGGTSGITFPDSTVQTTAATTPTAVANLSGGSAGVVPYQTGSGATSFTAAGTSGQVLTSAGTGTPTWATPSSGAMTLISTLTASNGNSTISFDSIGSYNAYFLIWFNLTPNSNNAMGMRFNNYTSSYVGNTFGITASGFNAYSPTNDPYMRLTRNNSSPYYGGITGYAYIEPTNMVIQGLSGGNNPYPQYESAYFNYVYSAGGTVTSIQLMTDSSTFASGRASLYGISS